MLLLRKTFQHPRISKRLPEPHIYLLNPQARTVFSTTPCFGLFDHFDIADDTNEVESRLLFSLSWYAGISSTSVMFANERAVTSSPREGYIPSQYCQWTYCRGKPRGGSVRPHAGVNCAPRPLGFSGTDYSHDRNWFLVLHSDLLSVHGPSIKSVSYFVLAYFKDRSVIKCVFMLHNAQVSWRKLLP